MQDVEFTIEDGALYMLQTRNGKRSAQAMARIAVDLVAEGVLSEQEALLVAGRARPGAPAPAAPARPGHGRPSPSPEGVNASPGAAVGAVVFTADEAERLGKAGEDVILVRDETTPDDFHGMVEAQGILTARGGKTSHAAIVAVGMGKPAVCGVTAIRFLDDGSIPIGDATFREGDRMTIDGTTGTVFAGDAPLVPPDPQQPVPGRDPGVGRPRPHDVGARQRRHARGRRPRPGVRRPGHRPVPHRAHVPGRRPPADRAEHDHGRGRRGPGAATCHKLRAFQQSDFEGIFRAMAGLPVTIRLLDPPLHEFLPDLIELSERVAVSKATGTPDPEAFDQIAAVRQLHEVNPMLGTRGCRLGIEWPDVYRMQVAAIMTAACTVKRETGAAPIVEIMIPLVGFEEELRIMRAQVIDVAEIVLMEQRMEVEYAVGTMIELPRAALCAREIAREADFFSFGTNDLTQTTLGFSRDDAENKFLTHYLQNNIITFNPFETIDQAGVGKLVEMAVADGRAARPGIKLGVCGEHGGDPESVMFFHRAGLDYVSCSPFRVQTARIAAARAALGA